MECIHCKGRMEESVVPFSIDRHGYHISWDAIPAWVCTQCGEPYFEAQTVDLMQKALAAIDSEASQLTAVRRTG